MLSKKLFSAVIVAFMVSFVMVSHVAVAVPNAAVAVPNDADSSELSEIAHEDHLKKGVPTRPVDRSDDDGETELGNKIEKHHKVQDSSTHVAEPDDEADKRAADDDDFGKKPNSSHFHAPRKDFLPSTSSPPLYRYPKADRQFPHRGLDHDQYFLPEERLRQIRMLQHLDNDGLLHPEDHYLGDALPHSHQRRSDHPFSVDDSDHDQYVFPEERLRQIRILQHLANVGLLHPENHYLGDALPHSHQQRSDHPFSVDGSDYDRPFFPKKPFHQIQNHDPAGVAQFPLETHYPEYVPPHRFQQRHGITADDN